MRTVPPLVLLTAPLSDLSWIVSQALRGRGYRVLAVRSGREAVRVLRTVVPQAVVLAGDLPDATTQQTSALLQILCPQAACVVVERLGPPDDLASAPDLDALLAALDTALQAARPPREAAETAPRLITVCAWCVRVRDGSGAWQTRGLPAGTLAEARCTHGICPECRRRQEHALARVIPA